MKTDECISLISGTWQPKSSDPASDQESFKMTITTKTDRVTANCPSGVLVYLAKDGRQVLAASTDLYTAVKDDMVYLSSRPPTRTRVHQPSQAVPALARKRSLMSSSYVRPFVRSLARPTIARPIFENYFKFANTHGKSERRASERASERRESKRRASEARASKRRANERRANDQVTRERAAIEL